MAVSRDVNVSGRATYIKRSLKDFAVLAKAFSKPQRSTSHFLQRSTHYHQPLLFELF